MPRSHDKVEINHDRDRTLDHNLILPLPLFPLFPLFLLQSFLFQSLKSLSNAKDKEQNRRFGLNKCGHVVRPYITCTVTQQCHCRLWVCQQSAHIHLCIFMVLSIHQQVLSSHHLSLSSHHLVLSSHHGGLQSRDWVTFYKICTVVFSTFDSLNCPFTYFFPFFYVS